MALAIEEQNILRSAINALNTNGSQEFSMSYKNIKQIGSTSDTVTDRASELKKLNQIGRAWYTVAAIQDFTCRAELKNSLFLTAFGGIRVMCAVPARGTYYLLALDVSVDINGGTVVTQWVTRKSVSAQNIPILLEAKMPTLRDSELSGDYFERYSEINAVTGAVRRTAEGMEKVVLQRLASKISSMRS